MQNKNIVISVEGGNRGGGAGTLANELSDANNLDVRIFKTFTHTKIDYLINLFLHMFTILKCKKNTRIILFDAMSTFLLGLICYACRRDYGVCMHGSEVDEFVNNPSRFKRFFWSKCVYKFILRKAEFIIVPSQVQKHKIVKIVAEKKIFVFPWGANVNIELIKFFENDFKARVVVVSRLANGKNISELLQECKKSLSGDIAVAVIGDGPLEIEVAALCASAPNLFYCGKMSNLGVQSVIMQVDAVLAPSSLKEAYGLSLRDAVMLDKYCLANRSGAHGEFSNYQKVILCNGIEDLVRKINLIEATMKLNKDQIELMQQRVNFLRFLVSA